MADIEHEHPTPGISLDSGEDTENSESFLFPQTSSCKRTGVTTSERTNRIFSGITPGIDPLPLMNDIIRDILDFPLPVLHDEPVTNCTEPKDCPRVLNTTNLYPENGTVQKGTYEEENYQPEEAFQIEGQRKARRGGRGKIGKRDRRRHGSTLHV
ncbi:hypothetical protein D9758_018755 [Tetrapyrgos nigripes]|uniref:Uncharacterized protein n=1 Tax=Tetrapyrgos nigripes TaxID=182062 RepID=A0A8H5AV03_9AGAR|nr:hypothetical protein D9758_018755 [Tetrapyrgos nigripes]